MAHEWICIISFYGWSSFVISFGLRQYLSFVPYIIERVSKYLWRRGVSLFFSDCDFFCRWFDFYTNLYKSPNSLRVIHIVSNIVCSVAQSVTCNGASLRINIKLPLLEAEDSSQSLLVPWSILCCLFTLLSSFFIFHPIHLKSIAAVQFPSYHLSWVGSSYFDPILNLIILLCIYEFVLCHGHCFRPIRIYKLVKLHTNKSHIRIDTRFPRHSTNPYIQISLTTYTMKSHVRMHTKYQRHTIWWYSIGI